MQSPAEARFYGSLPDGRVRCTLCPHECRIAEGHRGACGVRYNSGGRLYTLVYDAVVAQEIDPVEKKPLFHFYPGSAAYSIATVGCNQNCAFCQNWEIALWPKAHLPKNLASAGADASGSVPSTIARLSRDVPGQRLTPEQIVQSALHTGASSIAYTYTEPTIFYELSYDTARLARAKGLKNIFVSNGFISEAPLREIAALLDAINIDLKFFIKESYARVSRGRLGPVLDAIRLYRKLGVWVEVTTLVIPGLNDSEAELRQIAEFIRSVGAEVPWHVSRFHPAYKMGDVRPTPLTTLARAVEIGHAAGLRYVYQGNVPGAGGENTYCYDCRALLIDRRGYFIRSNRIRKDRCPECGAKIDGVALSGE